MNVISLKDYAKQHNISYEAVRKQVARFRSDLEGHIIQDGRQQFLDENAVAFLDARREKNPVSIIQQSKDEEIDTMRREREELLLKIAAQADRIAELAEWKAENSLLIAEASNQRVALRAANQKKEELEAENKVLISQKIDVELKLEETKKDLQDANFDLETAENIAKANEQEAARAKTEVEDLRRELEELKAFNALPWWKKIRMKKPPV